MGTKLMDKISNRISITLAGIGAVALVVNVFAMVIFIFARHFFNVGWMFIEEFSTYFMVLASFFPLAYTLRNKAHITVDVIVILFPKKLKSIMEIFTMSVSLAVICYLLYRSGQWFWEGYVYDVRSLYPSNLNMFPVYLIVPVGFAAFALELLLELFQRTIKTIQDMKEDKLHER